MVEFCIYSMIGSKEFPRKFTQRGIWAASKTSIYFSKKFHFICSRLQVKWKFFEKQLKFLEAAQMSPSTGFKVQNLCKLSLFHGCSKVLHFNKLTSYTSTPDLQTFFILSAWLTANANKWSHIKENVGESRPSCVNYLLSLHEEMMSMKAGMLETFHSKLKPVGLKWFFTKQIFPI